MPPLGSTGIVDPTCSGGGGENDLIVVTAPRWGPSLPFAPIIPTLAAFPTTGFEAAVGAGVLVLAGAPTTPTPQNGDEKQLPKCMRNFLKRYYPKANVDAVRLRNGSPFGLFGHSVTFGSTINLADSGAFNRPTQHARHIFHEFTHTRQYAAGSTVRDFVTGYIEHGGHDASPLEAQAIANSAELAKAFRNSPEARQCT